MGACMQGSQATLNGFACGRSTDVNGIALDSCGRLLVAWPAQAGLPTDATYASQQVGGPTLLPCKEAGFRPPPRPATSGSRSSDTVGGSVGAEPSLASTGGRPAVAIAGLALLAGAAVAGAIRRRTAG
jgi:hypothetical protein